MQCSFEETIDYPDGSFRRSTCINRAEIMLVNDPCFGLCYACAYKKLHAENERLKDFIKLEIDHAEAFSDLPVDSKHSMRAFIIRAKQALKDKQ